MQKERKTTAAARHLGVPYHRLVNLIRYGKIAAPAKDSSGDYLWSEEDLVAARAALARGPAREVGACVTPLV